MRNFLILHQSMVMADAIGHDIEGMVESLEPENNCFLYAQFGPDFRHRNLVDLALAKTLLNDRNTVVLYHHSIYWPQGEALLELAKGPILIKYHNVTPPSFFADRPQDAQKCALGREQTFRLAARFPDARWLPDSRFNIVDASLSRHVDFCVVPPFLSLIAGASLRPDEAVLRNLTADRRLQLFFVGRYAPNKGHEFMARVIAAYHRRFDDGIVVYIAGKNDQTSAYHTRVAESIARWKIESNFVFTGRLHPEQLLSYYLGTDAFLCCSEHEGFCVPIIEAQALCLPVVARAMTAVPETAGGAAVLLGDDPAEYADALFRLHTDFKLREQLVRAGLDNYERRFTQERIRSRFLEAVRGAIYRN